MIYTLVVMGLSSSGKSTLINSALGKSVGSEISPTTVEVHKLRFENAYVVEIGGEILEMALTEYVNSKEKGLDIVKELWDKIIQDTVRGIAKSTNKTEEEILKELRIPNIILTLDGGVSVAYAEKLSQKLRKKTAEKIEQAKIKKQEDLFEFLADSSKVFEQSKPEQFLHSFRETILPIINKSDKLSAEDAREVISVVLEKLGPLARNEIELKYKIMSALGIQVPIKELSYVFYSDDEFNAYKNMERLKEELGVMGIWEQYLAMNAMISLSVHGVLFNEEINGHLEGIIEHFKKELEPKITERDGYIELENYEELEEKIRKARLELKIKGKVERKNTEIKMHLG